MNFEAYSDSHGNANKQHVGPKADRNDAWLIPELMIQAPCNSASKSKGEDHRCRAHSQGYAPIATKKTEINLKSHKKEEQNQPKISDKGQIWHSS